VEIHLVNHVNLIECFISPLNCSRINMFGEQHTRHTAQNRLSCDY